MSAAQQKMTGRERIIAAARHLFATRGFHQTAMVELASEAQISVGQIYRLFENKNDIVVAIVQDDASERMADLRRIRDEVEDGAMSIERAFEGLALLALSEGEEALSFEILAEAHRNPLVAEQISQFCTSCRSILRDLICKTSPALGDRDIEAAEEMLLACLFGLGHRLLSRPQLGIEATAARTASMMIAALRN